MHDIHIYIYICFWAGRVYPLNLRYFFNLYVFIGGKLAKIRIRNACRLTFSIVTSIETKRLAEEEKGIHKFRNNIVFAVDPLSLMKMKN